jgi:LacI family transcriptional regulator
MAITIKDIAKIAGVSHTTVSRALNDSPLISEATKEKIKVIALEHNYQVNTNAKSLKLKKSMNIGLFFSTLGSGTSSDFLYKAFSGANKAVGDQYNLIVNESTNLDLVTSRKFDGIVLVSQCNEDDIFIEKVKSENIPLVVVNREVLGTPSFLSNDYEGSYQIVKHIIDYNHQKVAVIAGNHDFNNTTLRLNGYMKALEESDIKFDESLIMEGDYTFKAGYEAMKKLLSGVRPTAVFAFNDQMAVGAIKACFEEGVNVPEELSIVGFDESEISRYTTPELTTVARNIDDISLKATRALIELVEGKSIESTINHYDVELIIRKSVRRI